MVLVYAISYVLTNQIIGKYPGGMHRVSANSPSINKSIPERHSIAYFVATKFSDPIKTPESLIERDGGTLTLSYYHTSRLRQS